MKPVNNIAVSADRMAADEKKFHFEWRKQIFHTSLESRGLVFELTGVSSEYSAEGDSPDTKEYQYCVADSWIDPRVAIFATNCYLSKLHHQSAGARNRYAACNVSLHLIIAKLPEDWPPSLVFQSPSWSLSFVRKPRTSCVTCHFTIILQSSDREGGWESSVAVRRSKER